MENTFSDIRIFQVFFVSFFKWSGINMCLFNDFAQSKIYFTNIQEILS